MDDELALAWAQVIRSLGYDPDNPHLAGSPERVARFMRQWHTRGTRPPKLTCFPNHPKVDHIVAIGSIRFESLCAHHGLPFVGTAAVGYLPSDSVLGLSKFARVVEYFAHRFQVQEQLTQEIADHLMSHPDLRPLGVGVVLKAEHMCMSMRGVRCHDHNTVTSVMHGVFRNDPAARRELMELVR